MICSPLSIIPKQEKNSFHRIHDLSYPSGNSVKLHISEEFFSVKEAGRHALMSKSDIQSAFPLRPIHPDDYELLGFSVSVEEKRYFFLLVLV